MYDGETREIDAELGWLFELLELDGSLDQTWTVITSDHGEALGEHNRAVHTGPPWEVLIHVPLLIRPPGGLAQGQVHDDLVGLIDVVPTLLSQVGLPAVPAHAGRDLSPLLRGEPLAAVPQFAEEKFAARHRASVRDGDWKLIAEGPRRWLFNLAADPGETVDLAIAEPAQVAALEGLLAVWFQAAQAGVPSSSMDWEAARRSGMRWEAPRVQTETVGGDADELLRQLEAMGYVEVGDD
jgi:arylsulfatase A-like enzyme